jgi:hypothetical protein
MNNLSFEAEAEASVYQPNGSGQEKTCMQFLEVLLQLYEIA